MFDCDGMDNIAEEIRLTRNSDEGLAVFAEFYKRNLTGFEIVR